MSSCKKITNEAHFLTDRYLLHRSCLVLTQLDVHTYDSTQTINTYTFQFPSEDILVE